MFYIFVCLYNRNNCKNYGKITIFLCYLTSTARLVDEKKNISWVLESSFIGFYIHTSTASEENILFQRWLTWKIFPFKLCLVDIGVKTSAIKITALKSLWMSCQVFTVQLMKEDSIFVNKNTAVFAGFKLELNGVWLFVD